MHDIFPSCFRYHHTRNSAFVKIEMQKPFLGDRSSRIDQVSMDRMMVGIESCNCSSSIPNKDFVLNYKFYNPSFIYFNLASDAIFMCQVSEISFYQINKSPIGVGAVHF